MECDVNQLKSYIVSALASLSVSTNIQYLDDLAIMIKQHPFKSCNELIMGLIEGYIMVKIRQYLDIMYNAYQDNVVAYISSLVNVVNIALLTCTSKECIESLIEVVHKSMCGCGKVGDGST